MAKSVWYTLQHSSACVAWGVFTGKLAFRRYFPDKKFTELLDFLDDENGELPVDECQFIYRRAHELYSREGSLVRAVGAFLAEENYPCLPEKEAEKYYKEMLHRPLDILSQRF